MLRTYNNPAGWRSDETVGGYDSPRRHRLYLFGSLTAQNQMRGPRRAKDDWFELQYLYRRFEVRGMWHSPHPYKSNPGLRHIINYSFPLNYSTPSSLAYPAYYFS